MFRLQFFRNYRATAQKDKSFCVGFLRTGQVGFLLTRPGAHFVLGNRVAPNRIGPKS